MLRLLASVLLLLIWGAAPAQAAAGLREAVTLSAGWLFAKGDPPGAAEPGFDDAAWTRTTLPHTFNAGESGEGDYYRGPGWYRRAFEIDAIEPDRRLFVQFDGAALVADVYLNGRPACRHEGGHAAFRCDLTALIQPCSRRGSTIRLAAWSRRSAATSRCSAGSTGRSR